MLKNKRILLMLIFVAIIFLVPNMVQAKSVEATETTTTSTGTSVEWSYELDDDGNITNLVCSNTDRASISGNLSIPETIDEHKVLSIGYTNKKGAFQNCQGLTGIEIPDTVTNIAQYAFYYCTGLRELTLSKNLIKIGDYAFYSCSALKKIEIPNKCTEIGSNAFEYCSGCKTLNMADSVTLVGNYAFRNCSNLIEVNLSKNLTRIAAGVFSYCTSLENITLPENIGTIVGGYSWEGAFSYCTGLKKILIPDNVGSIGENSFYKCSKLTIYGNDGEKSQTYAVENEINFDYIVNWDKASEGTDVTAPSVESMYVKYMSVLNYWDSTTNTFNVPKGVQIIIVVNFSEQITGNTAPTLTIKCGTGNNIELTNGVISGDTVTYTYTIQETDLGQVVAVSLTGGDITDLSSNKAELSCKKLYVQYHSDNYAYANGKSADVKKDDGTQQPTDNSNSGTKEDDSNKGTQQPSSTDETTNKTTKNETQDETIKKDSKLPQTGITILSLFAVGLMLVALISKMKCAKYKDI